MGQLHNTVPQSQIRHDAPVLCSEFSADNVSVFTGGCDNVLKMWNVTQGPNAAQNIGSHDAPIKSENISFSLIHPTQLTSFPTLHRSIKFLPDRNVVVTGSWDKTVSEFLSLIHRH